MATPFFSISGTLTTVFVVFRLGGQASLGLFSDFGKSRKIMNSQIGQDLTVHFNTRQGKAVHHAAVGELTLTRTGVDASNPERTKLTFLLATVTVSVLTRFGDGLFGNTKDPTAGASVAFGLI